MFLAALFWLFPNVFRRTFPTQEEDNTHYDPSLMSSDNSSSLMAADYHGGGVIPFSVVGRPRAEKECLRLLTAAAAADIRYHVGNIFSADLFYTPDPGMFETMANFNVLGLEMEAAGIFPIAAEHNVEALAICTVSDHLVTGDALTSDERATTFDEMILVGLETAIAGSE